MQESMHHLTPNYVDFDKVVEESTFHDTSSFAIELPSLLDEVSTSSNQCGLFCDIDTELLNQIDYFTQRELNSESSVLQLESNPAKSRFEDPENNCVVDSQFIHYHQRYSPTVELGV